MRSTQQPAACGCLPALLACVRLNPALSLGHAGAAGARGEGAASGLDRGLSEADRKLYKRTLLKVSLTQRNTAANGLVEVQARLYELVCAELPASFCSHHRHEGLSRIRDSGRVSSMMSSGEKPARLQFCMSNAQVAVVCMLESIITLIATKLAFNSAHGRLIGPFAEKCSLWSNPHR